VPRYILKRLVAGVLTLLVLVTLTFALMHAIPGGPFSPADERNTPQSVLDRINQKYGLDKPVLVQYFNYLKALASGDLGVSFKQEDTTVNELVRQGFPVSARVGAVAVIVALLVGIPLGIVSAVKRGKWADWAAMLVATVGISIPSFVLAVLLMYLFSVELRWLPVFGLTSWKHYILPVTALAVAPISYIARLMRSSMLEVMRQDYIVTARSKGVRESMVILKHALKNAIIPVLTYLGPLVAGLLTGSFIVERLFTIPGIGRYFVSSIGDRDYSVILGMTVFFGAFIVISNLIVDILCAIVDPRMKMEDQ
jgi:oligopeptide transport system permease protein